MLFIAYKVSIVGLYTIHTDKRFGRDSVEVRLWLRILEKIQEGFWRGQPID